MPLKKIDPTLLEALPAVQGKQDIREMATRMIIEIQESFPGLLPVQTYLEKIPNLLNALMIADFPTLESAERAVQDLKASLAAVQEAFRNVPVMTVEESEWGGIVNEEIIEQMTRLINAGRFPTRVLVPTLGCYGSIVTFLRSRTYCPIEWIECFDTDPARVVALQRLGHPVHTGDFTTFQEEYDLIMMRSPRHPVFEISYVLHAYSLLREGGHLIALVSQQPFKSGTELSSSFMQWLVRHKPTIRTPDTTCSIILLRKPTDGDTH